MPAETTRVGMSTPDALALLPLPAQLSDPQRDGHVCVWGGEALVRGADVDLGSRIVDDRRVFPRSCTGCVSKAAMGVLFDHSTGPDACADCQETPVCDTGRALNRIIRMGRR